MKPSKSAALTGEFENQDHGLKTVFFFWPPQHSSYPSLHNQAQGQGKYADASRY